MCKSKNILLSITLYCCTLTAFSQSFHPNKDSLITYIQQLQEVFETPGLSVAIIQHDSMIFTYGSGTRTMGKDEAVNAETIFAIGSISKSFTSVALGILVDEGKLTWDDRVIDHLHYFELYDPYVTQNFTIRDLLTHRSGLKSVSGGTLWYGSDLSREEVIRGLKYLDPVSSFRTIPAYQNVMFVVAGEIVAKVSGMSWDDFVKERILEPLGMNRTLSRYEHIINTPNTATPHTRTPQWELISVPHRNHDNIAAAGSMYSTVSDMTSYIQLYLHKGVVNEDTIVSEAVIDEILTPQFHFRRNFPFVFNKFTSYGLGFWLTPFKEHTIVNHSGGVDGMAANMWMIPEKELGFIILSNKDKEPTTLLLAMYLIGNMYGENYDLLDIVSDNRANVKGEELSALKMREEQRDKSSQPSLSLDNYAGNYKDEMYGEILVTSQSGELTLSFSRTPSFSGRLSHWQHDTFMIHWNDQMIPPGFITFSLNAQAEITGFQIEQPNLLDVDFTELDIYKVQE